MIGTIYDGLQRPLDKIAAKAGAFITRGIRVPPIPLDKKWHFKPAVKKGDKVEAGSILGTVEETHLIEHRIMVPPDHPGGRVVEVVDEGEYTVEEAIATVQKDGEKDDLKMYHRWPVRQGRPYAERFDPELPLITGQRVIDTFFPIVKGGTAAIPGGFGTGKCVLPDTPVLLVDGTLMKIKDIFARSNRNYADQERTVFQEELVEATGLTVLAFDGLQLVKSRVSHVYRGYTDRMVKIRTASGREITVTPSHRLIVFNPLGIFEERPAELVSQGDYLVMPRKLPIHGVYQHLDPYSISEATIPDGEVKERVKDAIDLLTNRLGSKRKVVEFCRVSYDVLEEYCRGRNNPRVGFVQRLFKVAELEAPKIRCLSLPRSGHVIKLPERFDESLAEFLGLALSDGMVAGRQLRFFNKDHQILSHFSDLVMNIFGLEAKLRRFRTVQCVIVNNVLLIRLLKNLGYPERKKQARLPDIVLRSPDSVVAAFLRGYYLGGGSLHKGAIEFSSASKQLILGLGYALGRLGVVYSVRQQGSYRYRLIISGIKEINRFFEKIGCIYDKSYNKFTPIASHQKPERSQIHDIVPIDASLLKRWTDLSSRTQKEGIWIRNYTHLKEHISVPVLSRLVSLIPDSESTLSPPHLASALEWVFLDPITSIEVEYGAREVYDIVVPDLHNFVGGELPSLLHNTVTLHQIAAWADAKVVFHVGCGERGNEMTEVLIKFPELKDPTSGRPLMERTVLVANTSNMPVAAREASIYTGVTMAEYYRDMGYDVVLVADSTSRWAEALREISGRLEEMPAEEGYPSYLASRLAEFYERAGRMRSLGRPERVGSVTLVGAVSPSGADFTEPVTTHTLRFVKTFWGLDTKLAYSRHYPAINWITSYTGYSEDVSSWWAKNVDKEWGKVRLAAFEVLQREDVLREIVRLLGPEALPDEEKLILDVARMIKEGFLQQSAFDEVDTYCSPAKQIRQLRLLVDFHREALSALRSGVPLADIRAMPIISKIIRAKYEIPSDELERLDALHEEMLKAFQDLRESHEVKMVVK